MGHHHDGLLAGADRLTVGLQPALLHEAQAAAVAAGTAAERINDSTRLGHGIVAAVLSLMAAPVTEAQAFNALTEQ